MSEGREPPLFQPTNILEDVSRTIGVLKDRTRTARAIGLSEETKPRRPTPFRIDSPLISEKQKSLLMEDGIEAFEEYFKTNKEYTLERTYPSGKTSIERRVEGYKTITVDSKNAVGASEGLRVAVSGHREHDDVDFSYYEDDTYELVFTDRLETGESQPGYSSGRRTINDMSLPEWEAAMALINQAWFDMKKDDTKAKMNDQWRTFLRSLLRK